MQKCYHFIDWKVIFVKKQAKIIDYIVIAFLAVLLSLGYLLFIVKNKFAPAGFNGVAVMIQYKLNFSIGYFYLLLNVPLSIFAFFFIDKEFSIKTFIFCMFYSFSYLIFDKIDFLKSFQYDAEGVDTIFPCLVAGLISGFVYGMTFKRNASTGGVDIFSKFVSIKKPTANFFYVTFILNSSVAFASYFVYAEEIDGVLHYDWKPVCLCLLYAFLSSFVGSTIITGMKKCYSFRIITTHADEIEKDLMQNLRHGVTKIVGKGSYSGENKEILICVVNRHQLVDCQRIIKKYDNTFAFVESVDETIGNFKKIK